MLAHVTDWNDVADEESAPFCRAKRGVAPDPTKGAEPLWDPAMCGGTWVRRRLIADVLEGMGKF